MRSFKRWLALLIFVFPLPAHALTDVQEVVSPGGIKAWLAEDHSLPLLAVKVVFRDAGSAQDPAGSEGRTFIAASMLSEGTKKHEALEFNNLLESHAINLDFSSDYDTMQASLETLSEHRELAFSLMGEALTQPGLSDEAMDRVLRRAETRLKQLEQNPDYKLGRAWRAKMFGAHPYGKPRFGTIDSVKTIEPAMLGNYVSRYLTKQNIVVSVAGDVTPEQLKELLDLAFKDLPAEFKPDATLPEVSLPKKASVSKISHDIPQTFIMFGMEGMKRTAPDYLPFYVLNTLIGSGGTESRLSKEVREKRGLTYGIATAADPMLHSGIWVGSFSTRNKEAGNALGVVRTTLKAIADNGITDEELKDAKDYITGSFVLALDTNEELVEYLTSMQLYDLGRDYLARRNKLMEDVTREQVQTLAKKWFAEDRLTVVTVGQPEGINATP